MLDKNQAEILRIGLISGYIRFVDIIKWSDSMIQMGSDDFNYVEISTSSDINDLISKLKSVSGDVELNIVVYGFFSILYHEYLKHPDKYYKISKTLYWIMQEHRDYLTKDEVGDIYEIDDIYELSKQELHYTLEDLKRELYNFLSVYKGKYVSPFLGDTK